MSIPQPLLDFIWHLPKAELHLPIEGSLEPELMFALAQRNGEALPYASVEEVRAARGISMQTVFAGIARAENNFFGSMSQCR